MKIIVFFFSIIFLTSCPNEDVFYCNTKNPLEELAWLKKIKITLEQSASASKKQIIQYHFKGENVFLVDACVGCADNLTAVYNCEGTIICEFGGISGVDTCPNFDKEAVDKIIIYEN